MTTTDPAGFDPERTGEMRIPVPAMTLADKTDRGLVSPVTTGPGLVYVHSDGSTRTLVDRVAPGQVYDDHDDRLRELVLARALLVHALRLVDRELNA